MAANSRFGGAAGIAAANERWRAGFGGGLLGGTGQQSNMGIGPSGNTGGGGGSSGGNASGSSAPPQAVTKSSMMFRQFSGASRRGLKQNNNIVQKI